MSTLLRWAAALAVMALAFVAHPGAPFAQDAPRCTSDTAHSTELYGPASEKPAHPLIGKGLFTANGIVGPCSGDDIVARVTAVASGSSRPAIVLGEVHDNPWHHQLRATVIDRIASTARNGSLPAPALVFEHIRIDQMLDLPADWRASADTVFAALKWSQTGWPDSSLFKPVFETALKWQLPILAGHPASSIVRDVARSGADKVPADVRERFNLQAPLPDKLQNDLLSELEASHCGLMPKTAFTNMAVAQRYRDVHMADVVATASTERTAMLLTGNGHARNDRGVPYYLRAMNRPAFTVLFVEVEDGKTDARSYGPFDADAILFTARAERKDPCEEMRAMMQKKK